MKRCPIVGCGSPLSVENPATAMWLGDDCDHRFPDELVCMLPEAPVVDPNERRAEQEAQRERRRENTMLWTQTVDTRFVDAPAFTTAFRTEMEAAHNDIEVQDRAHRRLLDWLRR